MLENSTSKALPAWKIAIVAACAILTLTGIFDAVKNIPVVSGCAFYSQCNEGAFRKPPGAMGHDIP